MLRLICAAGLALATSQATAQTTSTQCRWIGNIWSCTGQTQQPSSPAPVDQGAILRSGASIVPPYQPDTPRPSQIPPLSPQAVAKIGANAYKGPYGLDANGRSDLDLIVEQCRSDVLAMAVNEKARIESPLFDGNGLNEAAQHTHRLICAAYSKGLADGVNAMTPK